MKNNEPEDETKRQLRIIHNLARRIPWIVVGVALVATLLIILQAFLLN